MFRQLSNWTISAKFLTLYNIKNYTCGKSCGTFFLSAGKTDLMTLSMKEVLTNNVPANFAMMPEITPVCDLPIQRLWMIGHDVGNFVLEKLRTSGISRCRLLFRQAGCRTPA